MAFDVITPSNLGRGAIATTPTLTTLYTVPALTRVMVKNIDISNTTAGSLTILLYLVPSGGTAGTGNILLPGLTVAPRGILQWTGSQILHPGDIIQATGSGAGLTANISGGICV